MPKKKSSTGETLRARALARAEQAQSKRALKQAATRRVGLSLAEASAEAVRERATKQGKAVAGQLKRKLASTPRTGSTALALAEDESRKRRATAQTRRTTSGALKSKQKEVAALRAKKTQG